MTQLLRETTLENGLTVRFSNASKPYFGDFHHVKLEIACEVLLSARYFATEAELHDACRRLGTSVVYRRTIEKMGVPTAEVDTVLGRLIASFVANSLPYLASTTFAPRFILAELAKVRKRPQHHYAPRHPLHD